MRELWATAAKWLGENWGWLAAGVALWLLWDIAQTLRHILTELLRPEDERNAMRVKHGIPPDDKRA